jgi:chorismate dehydratase
LLGIITLKLPKGRIVLFGSISYLNLLPFQLYLKRTIPHNGAKMAFRYKRDVPSRINRALRAGHINAAFVSSAVSRRFRCCNAGIVARGPVYSVLLIPGEEKEDPASATSNLLAKVLGIKGRVIIGDAALRRYIEEGDGIDLAEAWEHKTGLPFVFARLCFNRHDAYVKRITRRFLRSRIRIPQYILKKEAKKRGIEPSEAAWYLRHIHYEIDRKAEKGLKRFMQEMKKAECVFSKH